MRSVTLPPAIIARFRSLSLERLERIEAGWAALFQGTGDSNVLADVQQELHTLKGDSRVVGFNDIHLLSHKLEELVAAAHARGYEVREDFDLVVTMAIRLMVMLLRTRDGVSLGGIDVDGFVLQIDELLAESPAEVKVAESGPVSRRAAIPVEALDHVSIATQQRLAASATEVFLEHLRSAGPARARLLGVWGVLSKQISAFYAVSLGPRIARHQEAAQKLARDLGKEVHVTIDAGEVRVRVDAADALDTAILHLIRNAVDHGIEPPEEREQAGKARAGSIRVEVRVVGDGAEVSVEDDGHGVNLDEVRQRAISLGFMSRREAERSSEEDLVDLLLEPGFSTRTRVTEVSGRGVGLDAVRAALVRAGGKITLASMAGQGTKAIARVPEASRRLKVRCFRAAGADIVLAVPDTYDVAVDEGRHEPEAAPREPSLDPLEALAIKPARSAGELGDVDLLVRRDAFAITLRAGGTPYPRTAERFCPTRDDHPLEIVLLGDAEALLLRPEIIAARRR